ncbi:6PF2K-domain-containing protein [Ramicandelaber brevisporus]|nr:6PF2K-domain-containing protein [Ramicandelaber brevisporus]
MAARLYETASGQLFHAGQIAVILVGLPSRGKTHLSGAMKRYLCWLGVKTESFNVGVYRRNLASSPTSAGDIEDPRGFELFDPSTRSSMAVRMKASEMAFQDMINEVYRGGQVAIFDGANSSEDYRRTLLSRLTEIGVQVLFVESICDDPQLIERNIINVKIHGPDYIGWSQADAVADFKRRIDAHAKIHETITDTSLSFVKMFNAGERIVVNNVHGFLPTRIVFYLLNLHIQPRIIYLAPPPPECEVDLSADSDARSVHLTAADPPLSTQGRDHAQRLRDALVEHRRNQQSKRSVTPISPLSIWASKERQPLETATIIAGSCVPSTSDPVVTAMAEAAVEGMTPEQIAEQHPLDYKMHLADPYNHRFSRGESYHDLAIRLEAVILELEREKGDVMIVADETVLRCLCAYFDGNLTNEQIPSLEVKKNEIIEIVPGAYGSTTNYIKVN